MTWLLPKTLEDQTRFRRAIQQQDSDIYPKELKTYVHKNLHMGVYSSFIHNCQTWKQPRCPLVSTGINKPRPIQTLEYCSAQKQNELSSQEKTWRGLRRVLWSEMSQSEQYMRCTAPSLRHSGEGTIIETGEKSVTSRGWRQKGINTQCWTMESWVGEPTWHGSTVVGRCHYLNLKAVWSQCAAWMCSHNVFVSEGASRRLWVTVMWGWKSVHYV